MRCTMFTALFLLFAGTVAGQSRPADSEGLEGIRAEIRQLRQDLRTLAGTAQRAQILVARVQVQDAAVKRAQDQIDAAKENLTKLQDEERQFAHETKRIEDLLNQSDNDSKRRKELEEQVARYKGVMERYATTEGEAQTRVTESEEQLRIEQAKLGRLQDELDRLDKTLEQPRNN